MKRNTATNTNRYAHSHKAFEEARQVLPGGVNSPVRAYRSVGRDPIFIESGKGAFVTDIDGNQYIDYVLSYGPLILGHAADRVLVAINKAASHSTSFGMPTLAETTLAKMVIEAVPSMQMVRFVNSGTEATMSAIRLARAATGRSKLIKCTGCYHGHTDALLVEAGSGAMTHGSPSSAGVTPAIASQTLLVPYNDLDAVAKMMEQNKGEIAAMLIEPVAGNMGCIPPKAGYLQGLRELCTKHKIVLIFDEVMSGFRVAWGGAQALYNIEPDLTCLGKIVGGGLPCAAYGGKKEIMKLVAPDGPMYQAGTLSGNPLAMAAGIATLEALREPGVYQKLKLATQSLVDGMRDLATAAKIPVYCTQVGSMACVFFADKPITNYEEAKTCNTKAFTLFFNSLLDQGVVLPPSQFETWFVSTQHNEDCIARTLAAAKVAFDVVAQSGVCGVTDASRKGKA